MGLIIDDASVVYPAADGRPPVEALRRIDLAIEADDFVVALGASGCGKSTLLYLIAGFLSPTSGRIVLDGQPVQGPARRVVDGKGNVAHVAADQRQKVTVIDRLGQNLIGAGAQQADARGLIRCGQGDHGQIGRRRPAAQRRDQPDARRPRKVQQHQIRLNPRHHRQGRGRIGGDNRLRFRRHDRHQ